MASQCFSLPFRLEQLGLICSPYWASVKSLIRSGSTAKRKQKVTNGPILPRSRRGIGGPERDRDLPTPGQSVAKCSSQWCHGQGSKNSCFVDETYLLSQLPSLAFILQELGTGKDLWSALVPGRPTQPSGSEAPWLAHHGSPWVDAAGPRARGTQGTALSDGEGFLEGHGAG